METKLNIAEILKDKPEETKLYTDAFGELSIKNIYIESEPSIILLDEKGYMPYFYSDGKYSLYGEPILFPSKEMRDWSKFAWKKGDVLVSNNGRREVLFSSWVNDNYTKFVGFHCLITNDNGEVEYDNGTTVFNTADFHIEVEDAAQCYINTIEERLGSKLNLETLEVEKTQPEFKDGDIVTATSDFDSIFIGVLKKSIKDFPNNELRFYCALENKKQLAFDGLEVMIKTVKTSLATEEEKQKLFDALAKEGKAWDAEKKQIVDLKPKWTPKTFDRVITRDFDDGVWSANIFSHINSQGEYVSIGCVEGYAYCLPYNEETAKLIGTTNNAK